MATNTKVTIYFKDGNRTTLTDYDDTPIDELEKLYFTILTGPGDKIFKLDTSRDMLLIKPNTVDRVHIEKGKNLLEKEQDENDLDDLFSKGVAPEIHLKAETPKPVTKIDTEILKPKIENTKENIVVAEEQEEEIIEAEIEEASGVIVNDLPNIE